MMNVLWIMTDQHRADCLGFMGHPVVQTPHLDRLAASGIVFENAFCQSPACMASRAVLFTGRYPTAVRVRGMGVLPPSETTFPELLRRRGYRTAAFGKVHLTPEQYTRAQLRSETPTLDWRRFAADAALAPAPDDPCKENYGFEIHVGCEDILVGQFHDWLRRKQRQVFDRRPERFAADGPGDLYVSPYPAEFHPTTFIAEETAQFIREQKDSGPWFAFCSFVAPHHPFEAPQTEIDRYAEDSIPLPAWKGGVAADFIPPPASKAIGETQHYPPEIQRRIVWHYLAAVSLIDAGVGRVLEALEKSGQMDKTLIVFNSDHGEFLGNHGLLRKPSLHYDETLRVPLLIRLPGGQAGGRRVPGLVELTDVHPTLLGLLGIPRNTGVQGRDWSGALRAGGPIEREDVYSDMFDLTPQRFGELFGPYMAVQTLRTPRWKLNLYPTTEARFGQLFDLRNDPDETCNLYADPGSRAVREELLWRLLQRIERNTDPLPLYLTQF
jgi:arylsulfatase A-like enzyme